MGYLHPQAQYYNSKNNYDKLINWNNARESIIEINIDKRNLDNDIDMAMKVIVNKINKK